MNKILSIIFLTILVLNTNLLANITNAKVGYLSDIYLDLKYKNSQSALRIWIEDITKDAGINVHLTTYSSYDKLLDDYLNNKLQMLALNPYHYLKNEEKLNKKTRIMWDLQRSEEEKLQKLYVVVNKKSKINKISQLENKKILIKKNNYMAKMYLENLYLKSLKKDSNKFMSKIDILDKGSVLLKTFFGLYDACVVDSYEYDVMLELNPTLKKKLKILSSSTNALNNHMILFNKKNSDRSMEIYNETLRKFLKDSRKNHLFDLIKTNKISILKTSDLDNLREIYETNEQLKKKYIK